MRRTNPETPLYKQAIEWFTAAGYKAWRENSGRRGRVRFGFPGKPDVGGYNKRNGRALFVECKLESEKLTDDQWKFCSIALASKCDVFVYTDRDVYPFGQVPERMKPKGAK